MIWIRYIDEKFQLVLSDVSPLLHGDLWILLRDELFEEKDIKMLSLVVEFVYSHNMFQILANNE